MIHKSYELAISLDESNTLQDQVHDLMEILAAIHLVTIAKNDANHKHTKSDYCMRLLHL